MHQGIGREPQIKVPVIWATSEDADYAASGFDSLHPLASSKNLTAGMMAESMFPLWVGGGVFIIASPQLAIEAIVCGLALVFGLMSVFRIGLMAHSACRFTGDADKADKAGHVEEPDILPKYTVLLPVYKESNILPQLRQSMFALNYPHDKLDIIVLVEESDDRTLNSAFAFHWPGQARIIVAPKGMPQTKPRALNIGLRYARGSFLTIYDAEDRPHPEQLREAAAAFSDQSVGCVQAPLQAETTGFMWQPATQTAQDCPHQIHLKKHKRFGTWLSGHWGMEYLLQFKLLQPALAHFNLPIMLGGTSNHFRTRQLREMGGWDAWNVTEDAELGIRYARAGLRVKTINSPTLEKPPERLKVWLGQRSRWIKGYMQTLITYHREQAVNGSALSRVQRISINLLLAGKILSAFFFLPGCLMFLLSAFVGIIQPWMAAPLVLSVCATSFLAVLAPGKRNAPRIVIALSQVFYWPLHSIAAVMALKCFVKNPSFWNKTQH